MVTEGYRRCAPCRRPTPEPPPYHSVSTEAPVYRCILLAVLKKNIFFLRCFGPFGGHGFYLGDVQKHRFLHGFGLEERPGKELDDGWPESVEEQSLLVLVWKHYNIRRQYIKDV